MPITRLNPTIIPPVVAGTAIVSTVATSAVVATLLVANADRTILQIQNPVGGGATANRLFVKFGAAATTTDYSFFLDPGDFYESDGTVYTGIVTAILNSAGPRNIQVTEGTP